MSNIFKRLRLMGRSKEREEVNGNNGTEAQQQNNRTKNDTEHHHEENFDLPRGDFCHQRPRYRKGARKRLCFPSKHDNEPPLSCSKSNQERIPLANHKDDRQTDAESGDVGLVKDSITGKENCREMSDHAVADVGSNLFTEGAEDLNESFEVLMPDLSFTNGNDQSAKKTAQSSNEATPEPPVLHRMDTGPRPRWSSKVDMNLSVKSPVTRSQSRKEDLQLLKLLCSDDDDTTQKNPLHLFSLSKDKRRPGFPFDVAPLKVSEAGRESLKKKSGQIERNDLNTPLEESNIRSATIMTRSSRKRKQMVCGETNKCKDLNVVALELPKLHGGIAEDLNGNTAINGIDKQDSELDRESDKENKIIVGNGGLKELNSDGNQLNTVNKSQENPEEPDCKCLKFSVSAENLGISDDIKTNCLQDDPVQGGDVEEIQLKQGNASRESDNRESVGSTAFAGGLEGVTLKSSESSALSEVSHGKIYEESQSETKSLQGVRDRHPKAIPVQEDEDHQDETTKVLQGVEEIDGLESKNRSNSREGTKFRSRQGISEPAEIPNADYSSEETKKNSDETTLLQERGVDPMKCNVEDTILGDIKEPISQESPRPRQVIEADNENKKLNSQKYPKPYQVTETDSRVDGMRTVSSDTKEPYSQKSPECSQVIEADNRLDRVSTFRSDIKEPYSQKSPRPSQAIEADFGSKEQSSQMSLEPSQVTEADERSDGAGTVSSDTKEQNSKMSLEPSQVTEADERLDSMGTVSSDTKEQNNLKSQEPPQEPETDDRLDEMSTVISVTKEPNNQNRLQPYQVTETNTTLDDISTVSSDTKEPKIQKSLEPPQVTKAETTLDEVSTVSRDTNKPTSQKSPGPPQEAAANDRLDTVSNINSGTKEPNSQKSPGPHQVSKADTTLDGVSTISCGNKDSNSQQSPEPPEVTTADIIDKVEFDEISEGKNIQPISHGQSKPIDSPKGMDGSEGLYPEAQQAMVNVLQGASLDGLFSRGGNKSRESIRRMTEPNKSTKFETHFIGGVGFNYRGVSLPPGPQNNPVRCDLSPTITPRDTYEMFAAPNSYGDFNGRWPIAEGNRSHSSTRRRRGRKSKTELWQRALSYPVGNLNAYNLPGNDFNLKIAGTGSYCLQGDGMFAVAGSMLHSQSQGFSDAGRYYGGIASMKQFRRKNDLDLVGAALHDSGICSRGVSRKMEFDPSRIDSKDFGDHRHSANVLSQKHAEYNDLFIQDQIDGHCMIDNGGCYIPVNPYGPMIPPSGFQDRYTSPLGQQYYPDPNQYRQSCRKTKTDKEKQSMCDEKQKNDYQIMVENSWSTLKSSADGDRSSINTNQQATLQDMQDMLDALRILLRDAFDPSVSDPGELLATYGAELLKDEELRLEFIQFCEQLLSYEIMKNQSEGYFPGACGDFAYPYPSQAPLWPPANQYPPGCYPSDIAYYYDGESYLPMRVQPDQQGNMCMMLPDGHPDQYGPKDFIPIYAGPEGLCVNVDSFSNPGAKEDQEQLAGNPTFSPGSSQIN